MKDEKLKIGSRILFRSNRLSKGLRPISSDCKYKSASVISVVVKPVENAIN
jgi:hypothetical protein